MLLEVFQVDAFTTNMFEGNPAGVVLHAEGLSERQMVQIANELHNSETAFIFDKGGAGYDLEVRFFTPTQEVPICGHATIATHYVYAKVHEITSGIIKQKTKVGILDVEIIKEGDDLRIVMTQAAITFGKVLAGKQRQLLLSGLDISEQDLDASLPIQIISTGHSKVMVPLLQRKVLDALFPKSDILSQLSKDIHCNGFYTFTFDSGEEGILTSGRMFAPAIGIQEDPVTGNANGPLGAYLTHYGRLEKRTEGTSFMVKQGEALGRKGYMQVQVFSSPTEPNLVKVSGRARIIFTTTIKL
ncbi:phenazine biosynthesis protein PhzF family [Sphaerochaeta pleomorpha str. Grapes]|uniref:Phenazine biosynthesis protein PhzF family n=1 Tax=Sphaerochaeta pleomorpha (strain ATCC BAA-1885 / DSM 22778 / Grapes) TaxID=158190 RepID=G8QVD7_SPHPG|nr:PhzF family isomerase [Sphaerochaeta pleomorpha]AEV30452.1 phenazine biosynthesis protein PhzF family [Sphaerochaeta pleomorpha str. Grapes]